MLSIEKYDLLTERFVAYNRGELDREQWLADRNTVLKGDADRVWDAYRSSKKRNLDMLDIDDVIWEESVKDMVGEMKSVGISTFTVSVKQGSMADVLAALEESGCRLVGLVKVDSGYTEVKKVGPDTAPNGGYEEVPRMENAFLMVVC